MLSTLAFNPSQPRDEQGQWTDGGFERVSATDATGSGLNSEWSAAHGEADGPFWNVTGEKNARYWTIRDDSGKLVAGATTISRGLMTEVKAIGSHAQGQGQKLLDEIKAKNVWVVALAVPTAISFFTKNGFQKTDEAPGDYNVKWRRPAVRALSFPLAPARGARLLLLAAMRVRGLAFDPAQPRDDQGQWTGGSAPDLGEHDLPKFDENDEHSPEWRTILAHDAFLDRLDERGDENFEKMAGAVDEYVHAPDRLNNALRANPELMDESDDEDYDEEDRDGALGRGRAPSSLAAMGKELENAMADAPKIKEPVTVYRGLRGVTVEELAGSKRVTLNGFQSTSFDPKVAASFMGEKSGGLATGKNLDGVLLKIEAKYGIAFGHAHSVDGEMEMLLPHGDSYDVIGVGRVKHGGGTFPMVHLKQR